MGEENSLREWPEKLRVAKASASDPADKAEAPKCRGCCTSLTCPIPRFWPKNLYGNRARLLPQSAVPPRHGFPKIDLSAVAAGRWSGMLVVVCAAAAPVKRAEHHGDDRCRQWHRHRHRKAVVPGVTVNLSGPALITVQTTATDEAGVYRFSAVPPGDYAMTFALSVFATVVREGVRVGLGFTASVDAELRPGGVTESVLVTGSPVIDLASTEVTAHFDSDKLTTLPGARDVFAVLANTPGVAVAKMDVGGNGALAVQEYAAYGLRATSGVSRYEVEGLRTGANGINDIYLPDFASFAEVAVKAVGHSAAIPVPGTLVQHISKSGGNVFRGSAYADFQSDAWEATNIDDDQIARGVSGGPGLDARDVNRLQRFRDFTADAGGSFKDKAWWYTAYRDTDVRQRYAWLLDTSGTLLTREWEPGRSPMT